MNMCTLIGRVSECEPVLQYTSDLNEKFYRKKAKFYDTDVDVVVSEYLLKDAIGKVKITGMLATRPARDVSGKKVTDFYIDVINIVQIEDDVPDSNEVYVSIRVTKVNAATVTDSGSLIVKVVALNQNPKYKRNTIYLCAKDISARQLRDVKPGTALVCKGYLKNKRGNFEILINEII